MREQNRTEETNGTNANFDVSTCFELVYLERSQRHKAAEAFRCERLVSLFRRIWHTDQRVLRTHLFRAGIDDRPLLVEKAKGRLRPYELFVACGNE